MNCVSLFSGCGGLDLGLERAGFEVVVANDSEPVCAESYKANFPDTPFLEGSIVDVAGQVIAAGRAAGGVDLIAGGPPCPPYSKSRFYRKDKPRALEDRLGDDTMNGYIEVLKGVRPRAFIFENVAGFAYKVHETAMRVLLGSAEKLGYCCSWRVVNAADYGVPQIRERCFVIGMLGDEFTFPEPTHARDAGGTLLAAPLEPWRTAGEVLSELDTEANADDTGHFAGGKHHHLLKEIPPGDNYLFFTAKRGHPAPLFEWRSRYWSFLLKLSPDLPSWTIQARRSNNMGPFHWRNRILRIAEVKRLQTFPDGWHLAGKLEQQWRQLGNAVPPVLAERLGEAMIAHLRDDRDSLSRAA